jgi:spastin
MRGRKKKAVQATADKENCADGNIVGIEQSVEQLATLKVVELRAKLKLAGLTVSGRKADLVVRLESFYTQERTKNAACELEEEGEVGAQLRAQEQEEREQVEQQEQEQQEQRQEQQEEQQEQQQQQQEEEQEQEEQEQEQEQEQEELQQQQQQQQQQQRQRQRQSSAGFQRMVMCGYCGEKASYASISRHQKSCCTKRIQEQGTLPKQLRKDVHLGSIEVHVPGELDPESVYVEYNNAASKAYEAACPQCPSCQRTFFAGRLLKHMNTCCPTQEQQHQQHAIQACPPPSPPSKVLHDMDAPLVAIPARTLQVVEANEMPQQVNPPAPTTPRKIATPLRRVLTPSRTPSRKSLGGNGRKSLGNGLCVPSYMRATASSARRTPLTPRDNDDEEAVEETEGLKEPSRRKSLDFEQPRAIGTPKRAYQRSNNTPVGTPTRAVGTPARGTTGNAGTPSRAVGTPARGTTGNAGTPSRAVSTPGRTSGTPGRANGTPGRASSNGTPKRAYQRSNSTPVSTPTRAVGTPARGTTGNAGTPSRAVSTPGRTSGTPGRANGTPGRASSSSSGEESSEQAAEIAAEFGIDAKLVDVVLNEVIDRSPGVSWSDIAGLEIAKQTLQEAVILPTLRPDIFKGLRAPPKGVLLFGPPGTGKTMLAKAVATESKATFFSISASSLTSKWVGEGEKLVRSLFAVASFMQPAVIFVDEIDSLLSARRSGEHEASRRMKTEFLVQLDGANSRQSADGEEDRVLLMGATNRPQELDDAVIRRMVKRIYVPLPDTKSRGIFFDNMLSKQHHSISADDMHTLTKLSEGYSCSDLAAVCRDAAYGPIRSLGMHAVKMACVEDIRPMVLNDFKDALQSIKASVSKDGLREYEKWGEQFGLNASK